MPRLLYFLLRCSTVKLIIIRTQIYLYRSLFPLSLSDQQPILIPLSVLLYILLIHIPITSLRKA
jgi:hypothetical protein